MRSTPQIVQPFLIPNAEITPNMMANTTRVLADHTNTANSANSTTLTMALSANTNYNVLGVLMFTNTGSSTFNAQVAALASGCTMIGAVHGQPAVSSTGTPLLASADGANAILSFWLTVTVGTSPTTLEIDFLDAAGVGTTTCKAGSWMQVSAVA